MVERIGDSLAEFFVSDEERGADLAPGVMEGPEAADAAGDRELMVFWVADELYAVDIDEIQEIMKVPEITAVPRVDSSVLGIISLRGTVVPLLDLRRVLGLDVHDLTRQARILVIKAGGDPIGLVVDRASNVVRIHEESIEPMPVTMQPEKMELIEGVGRAGAQLVIILDVPAVVRLMERVA